MRVNVVCGFDLTGDGLPQKTCALLTEQFGGKEAVTVTEEDGHIVHVIGAWHAFSIAAAKKAISRNIPFIHTPLASLSPWNKPAVSRLRLSGAAQAVVASGKMEEQLLGKQSNEHLFTIPNAVTTNTTTPEEMADAYAELYEKLVAENDIALWEGVDAKMKLLNETDENIVKICRDLLYAQGLYRRRIIPKSFLSRLTALLVASDYDEDRFAELLEMMNIYDFSARLFHVMEELTGLTEGFMPVPAYDDKEAKDMMKTVAEY